MIKVKQEQYNKLQDQIDGIRAPRDSVPQTEREIPIQMLDADIEEGKDAKSANQTGSAFNENPYSDVNLPNQPAAID